MAQVRRWHIYPNVEELETSAARAIARAAAQAIAAHGRFTIALAGGHTPLGIYRRLADVTVEWEHWHVYVSDERCRPIDHADRNDRAIRHVWLDRVPIPWGQVHSIPAERGPQRGAEQYAEIIEAVSRFDFVLLGLGDDGHTASLLPDHPFEGADVLPVHDSLKPPPERVTLSAPRLSRTRQTVFVVASSMHSMTPPASTHSRPGRGLVFEEEVLVIPDNGLQLGAKLRASSGT